ncbi:hypothetical protein Tco_1388029 [Tanacetum coccineum]
MNQEVTHQVAARDEKWVPTKERVKISTTNAFTISDEVPKIFMHQLWYIVKKVSGTNSYEFLLANKKCVVDAEVFQNILDICPRVQGVEFAEVPDDEATLTFLLSLGYKGNILQGKCDYPELIWEDFAFQIDHRQLKKGRRENMPYPRLKFVKISEDYQEYGLSIPKMMLTDGITQSESYQIFIKYSTSQIPPKKSKGKGSHEKKTADATEETVDVYKESDPKHARKKTASRRVVKKKVTITADDNIIPELDVALELGKSISLTEAAEKEAARQVHATHARIVTEPIPEPARRRPSCIDFRDTSSMSKKMSSDPSQKLKGVQTLTPKEQIMADTMKALKESKKTSRRQPGVPDKEKVTSKANVILEWGSEQESEYSEEEDDDETIEWVDTNEEEEKKDDDDDKRNNLEQTDDEETDDEFMHGEEHVKDDDEETDDEFVHGDEQVNVDEDEEMTNAKDEESMNGDEEITDATKVDAGKTEEVKDDAKKVELPPTSSSLSVSLGFGDQFLKLSSDTSLIGTAKDTTYAEINLYYILKSNLKFHISSLYPFLLYMFW